MKKVIVLGAGQMGSGIAQVCAQNSYSVQVYDLSSEALGKAKSGIGKSLEKLFAKEKISEKPEEILSRLDFIDDVSKLDRQADVLIEAVSEKFSIKESLFRQMDELLHDECVFCSNTSSISITRLAAQTKRAEKFVGMHFMNPVPIMPLVELIRGLATSKEVFSKIESMAKNLGKTTIVSEDRPGFVVNRILMPMINEACFALQENLASAEDIDAGMKLGTNQPMGPLTLADFIGLDTCLAIMEVLHEGFGDTKYRPCPLLRQYVEAGYLGRKSGRGIYQYS